MHGPTEQTFEVDGCETVSKLFRKRTQELGDRVAIREKDLGIWRAVTWREYGQKAREVAMGLAALGLERGEVTAVLSENNREWLFADLGTICAGGVTNGIYTTDSPKQLAYLCNDSRAKVLFVENEEQLDKWLEVRDEIPSIEKVVIFDMEGLRDFSDPMAMTMEEFYELGRRYDGEHPEEFDARVDAAKPDDLMILIYTSGTTGPPKGAMISHRNVIFQLTIGNEIYRVQPDDQQLSFLPLSHIAERSFTTFFPLRNENAVNFAESVETVAENIREVSPHIFLAVPRVWEKFYSTVQVQLDDATAISRWAYRQALKVGYARLEYELEDKPVPAGVRLAYGLANLLVLRNLKRLLGMERLRWAATGAAPISPDLIKWYRAIGVKLFEIYGQTENTGTATANEPDRVKLGTVGRAEDGTEVSISPEGEILLKGPHVFMGYLNQPEKTAETIADGWLHTGDVGYIDNEGYVRVTDRMKDIIITAGGKNITPSEIENQLKFSPYISDAVVIGDKRKFLSALIMIDHDNVVKYAQDHSVPFTNYASLCRAQEVQDLIWAEIEKVNKNFARVETIKSFRLIDQLLTAEDDELTPTMKLKRKFVNEKYKELIDSMYQGA